MKFFSSSKIILRIIGFLYRHILKRILFCIDAEMVHVSAVSIGEFFGNYQMTRRFTKSLFFLKPDVSLRQKFENIVFQSPVGLAAGFDYEGRLTQILPDLGFGFSTIGTITHQPYEGNPKPRLGRFPMSRSLLVNKGFKNNGAVFTAARLEKLNFDIPIGVSIGKTNILLDENESIDDIVECFKVFEGTSEKRNFGNENAKIRAKTLKDDEGVSEEDTTRRSEAFAAESLHLQSKGSFLEVPVDCSVQHSYYELNISCPNLSGTVSFYDIQLLRRLLEALKSLHISRPVFVKMPTSKSNEEVVKMIEVLKLFPCIKGLIFGNLSRDPSLLHPLEANTKMVGSFSGMPVQKRSDELIRLAYKMCGKQMIIIGCGGIFDAHDAYRKIRLGASLLQLITGMIFEGPQFISELNDGLGFLLKKDGFQSISDAIGVDV
ncbi:hypothetical protein HYV57_00455 [Candidatus Peregrinibacteria bacterium]|nr:hypothetical protein [Candidatus Peregrinibacteria bacterium]